MAVVPILATVYHGGGGAVRGSTVSSARPGNVMIDAIRIYRNI